MSCHVYAFGSVCRGEIAYDSDVDLLAVVDGIDNRFNPLTYAIYSRRRIRELWAEGNPFAWHLNRESKLIYAGDGVDFLKGLGDPSSYANARNDCVKFASLYEDALRSYMTDDSAAVFDLSAMFLAVRNFSSCYLLGVEGVSCFSRMSAMFIKSDVIPVSAGSFEVLLRARVLSTRGSGTCGFVNDLDGFVDELRQVHLWMLRLIENAFR